MLKHPLYHPFFCLTEYTHGFIPTLNIEKGLTQLTILKMKVPTFRLFLTLK